MRRIFILAIFCLVGTFAHAADDPNVKLFEVHSRLAAKGSAEAQFKLGEMCEDGRGTPRDLEKAREWYELAAGQGHEEAQRRLTTLGKRKPHDDAERMARDALLIQQHAEEERKAAALAQQREEEERRAAAERRRAEEERQRQVRQKDEAELQAQRRAEEERARRATALQRQQEEEKRAVRTSQPTPQPTPSTPMQQDAVKSATPSTNAASNQESFETDPCKGPAARFMSTCR